jgi:hypothetical protein
MKKTFTASLTGLLVAGVLIFPAAVDAQTQKAADAMAPATAPAAPAAPVTVTPEARAAIKELIETTQTRENLQKAFQMMSQNLPPQMAQAMNASIENNPSLTPEQKQKVRANMNQPFDNAVKDAMTLFSDPKVLDESIERMYPIYAKYYTPAEIKQVTAFYKTPVGAKSLAVMPQIINESMQAGFSIFQPRLNALMEKTVKKEVDNVQKASPAAAPASGPAPAKK